MRDAGAGAHIELFQPIAETPAPGSESANDPLTHVALAAADARAATERVRQAGYEITVEPKDVDLGGLQVTIAFFIGPCGEVLEFFQTH